MTDQELLKVFNTYLKMFNMINGTTLTAKEAIGNTTFATSFKEFYNNQQQVKAKMSYEGVSLKAKKVSTKKQSYNALNLPLLDKQVYDYIKARPHASRDQIATDLGRKVSTICGAVNRLTKAKLITVSGTTVDLITGRNVETLMVVEGMFKK
jgi:DNA-binding MarR family transcriptional regulator